MSERHLWRLVAGKKTGPYAPEKLRPLVKDGRISPLDRFSYDGESWGPVPDFPELLREPVAPVAPVVASVEPAADHAVQEGDPFAADPTDTLSLDDDVRSPVHFGDDDEDDDEATRRLMKVVQWTIGVGGGLIALLLLLTVVTTIRGGRPAPPPASAAAVAPATPAPSTAAAAAAAAASGADQDAPEDAGPSSDAAEGSPEKPEQADGPGADADTPPTAGPDARSADVDTPAAPSREEAGIPE